MALFLKVVTRRVTFVVINIVLKYIPLLPNKKNSKPSVDVERWRDSVPSVCFGFFKYACLYVAVVFNAR